LRTPGCTVVEARERQQHALRVRQRAARQPGAGAARDHRHAELAARAQQRGDLRLGVGNRDRERQLAVGGEAVALVRPQRLGVGEQPQRGGRRAQARAQRFERHQGGTSSRPKLAAGTHSRSVRESSRMVLNGSSLAVGAQL
jgi:hypothetical protein